MKKDLLLHVCGKRGSRHRDGCVGCLMVLSDCAEPMGSGEGEGEEDAEVGSVKYCREVLGLNHVGYDPRAKEIEKMVSKDEVMRVFGGRSASKKGFRVDNCVDGEGNPDLELMEFVRDLHRKVYRNSKSKEISLAFARGVLADRKGAYIDWATFAHKTQTKQMKMAASWAERHPGEVVSGHGPGQGSREEEVSSRAKELPCEAVQMEVEAGSLNLSWQHNRETEVMVQAELEVEVEAEKRQVADDEIWDNRIEEIEEQLKRMDMMKKQWHEEYVKALQASLKSYQGERRLAEIEMTDVTTKLKDGRAKISEIRKRIENVKECLQKNIGDRTAHEEKLQALKARKKGSAKTNARDFNKLASERDLVQDLLQASYEQSGMLEQLLARHMQMETILQQRMKELDVHLAKVVKSFQEKDSRVENACKKLVEAGQVMQHFQSIYNLIKQSDNIVIAPRCIPQPREYPQELNPPKVVNIRPCPVCARWFYCGDWVGTSCGCVYHLHCAAVWFKQSNKCCKIGCAKNMHPDWLTAWGKQWDDEALLTNLEKNLDELRTRWKDDYKSQGTKRARLDSFSAFDISLDKLSFQTVAAQTESTDQLTLAVQGQDAKRIRRHEDFLMTCNESLEGCIVEDAPGIGYELNQQTLQPEQAGNPASAGESSLRQLGEPEEPGNSSKLVPGMQHVSERKNEAGNAVNETTANHAASEGGDTVLAHVQSSGATQHILERGKSGDRVGITIQNEADSSNLPQSSNQHKVTARNVRDVAAEWQLRNGICLQAASELGGRHEDIRDCYSLGTVMEAVLSVDEVYKLDSGTRIAVERALGDINQGPTERGEQGDKFGAADHHCAEGTSRVDNVDKKVLESSKEVTPNSGDFEEGIEAIAANHLAVGTEKSDLLPKEATQKLPEDSGSLEDARDGHSEQHSGTQYGEETRAVVDQAIQLVGVSEKAVESIVTAQELAGTDGLREYGVQLSPGTEHRSERDKHGSHCANLYPARDIVTEDLEQVGMDVDSVRFSELSSRTDVENGVEDQPRFQAHQMNHSSGFSILEPPPGILEGQGELENTMTLRAFPTVGREEDIDVNLPASYELVENALSSQEFSARNRPNEIDVNLPAPDDETHEPEGRLKEVVDLPTPCEDPQGIPIESPRKHATLAPDSPEKDGQADAGARLGSGTQQAVESTGADENGEDTLLNGFKAVSNFTSIPLDDVDAMGNHLVTRDSSCTNLETDVVASGTSTILQVVVKNGEAETDDFGRASVPNSIEEFYGVAQLTKSIQDAQEEASPVQASGNPIAILEGLSENDHQTTRRSPCLKVPDARGCDNGESGSDADWTAATQDAATEENASVGQTEEPNEMDDNPCEIFRNQQAVETNGGTVCDVRVVSMQKFCGVLDDGANVAETTQLHDDGYESGNGAHRQIQDVVEINGEIGHSIRSNMQTRQAIECNGVENGDLGRASVHQVREANVSPRAPTTPLYADLPMLDHAAKHGTPFWPVTENVIELLSDDDDDVIEITPPPQFSARKDGRAGHVVLPSVAAQQGSSTAGEARVGVFTSLLRAVEQNPLYR